MKPALRRHGLQLQADSSRVLLRAFIPRDPRCVAAILDRALALEEAEVVRQLRDLRQGFEARHQGLDALLAGICARVLPRVPAQGPLSRERQLLIGALFSGEYALEAAALFNPSIVPHPDQGGLPAGALRFILSLRATGEGHISSIEFRTGTLSAGGEIDLDPASRFATAPELLPPEARRTLERVQWLADPTYELQFPPDVALSERVLFPVSANERNGIEDARFVRFTEEDGRATYFATYTAYDGRAILPQLIETADFLRFRILTLGGDAVRNKGMALFPRRIQGQYVMLGRQDDENLYLMRSQDPHAWSDPQVLLRPARPWESVKLGNCGSPLETRAGWLVLTHGVGPMRRYCIGAALLDLEDPTKVLGRLREPLLEPEGPEREGYVPNVVYSCGSLIHGSRLILPYAMSDRAASIASVDLEELLGALRT